MKLAVDVAGVDAAVAETAKQARRHVEAFRAAEFAAASDILEEIVPLAPRLTGELQASSFVTREPVEAGFAAEHAAAVHAKGEHRGYLQRPMSTASSSTPARIAALMPGFIERGVTVRDVPAKHAERPDGVARQPARRRRRPRVSR